MVRGCKPATMRVTEDVKALKYENCKRLKRAIAEKSVDNLQKQRFLRVLKVKSELIRRGGASFGSFALKSGGAGEVRWVKSRAESHLFIIFKHIRLAISYQVPYHTVLS